MAGVGLIGVSILTREGAMIFVDLQSALIVIGGTVSATLVNFPLRDVLSVFRVVKNVFLHKVQSVDNLIEKLVQLSRKARVEGLLSLEKDIAALDDEFVKKGLQLMVDGTETGMLRDILTTELSCLEERHTLGQAIFKAMGAYFPAFGMAGTLIGLIQMLSKLNDPTKIGAGMATALVTTFYGVLGANLLCLPMAGKLKTRSRQEILNKELVIEGICSIQAGDNPRLLRDKLVMFVAPDVRKEAEKRLEAVR